MIVLNKVSVKLPVVKVCPESASKFAWLILSPVESIMISAKDGEASTASATIDKQQTRFFIIGFSR